jgi:hypothetical protein
MLIKGSKDRRSIQTSERKECNGDDFEDIHKTKWSDYHGINLIVGDESKIVTLEHPKTGKIYQD